MLQRALHIILFFYLLIPLQAQITFDADTVQFELVSGPELADIFKNDLITDARGLIWSATQAGLFAFDGYDWKGGLSATNDPLVTVDQWLENVQCDSTGQIWFGSQISGLHRLDVSSGRIQAFRAAEFTREPIHNILGNELPLIENRLIVQTYRGFLHFDPYREEYVDNFIPYPDRSDETVWGLPGASRINSIHHFLPDQQERDIVWLGTRDGLLKYNELSQTVVEFDWPFDNPQMPDGHRISVVDIHQSGDSLLIGTYGSGFISCQKDQSGFRVHLLEPADRIYPNKIWSNVVQQITPLNDSVVLFGSNLGPGIFHWKTGEVEYFSRLASQFPVTDLRSSTFRNIIVDNAGCLWTNNYQGVYRSVAALFPARKAPQLLITYCSVADGPEWRGYTAGLGEAVQLVESQNTIELTYALVNPVRPESIRYQHRLHGFDKDWVAAGKRRFVRYANLKGGRYVLEVRATDADGRAYQQELLRLEIETPFYKTPWFILLVSGVGLAFLLILYRQHIRNIRVREKLRSEFDLKLSNMEMQSLRSQMNPHFIFNSLNSIKYFVINQDADQAAEYLTKFARLIRMILENSKSEVLSLDREIDALSLYVEIEQLRFEDGFESNITVDQEIELSNFVIPPMLIQPYVENAIWHGLMHKQDGPRKLNIEFHAMQDHLKCVVEDNGIGRQAAAVAQKTRKYKKQSLGRSITQDRIDMINKLYHTQVSTTTEDLVAPGGGAAGTRVTIRIPNLKNLTHA